MTPIQAQSARDPFRPRALALDLLNNPPVENDPRLRGLSSTQLSSVVSSMSNIISMDAPRARFSVRGFERDLESAQSATAGTVYRAERTADATADGLERYSDAILGRLDSKALEISRRPESASRTENTLGSVAQTPEETLRRDTALFRAKSNTREGRAELEEEYGVDARAALEASITPDLLHREATGFVSRNLTDVNVQRRLEEASNPAVESAVTARMAEYTGNNREAFEASVRLNELNKTPAGRSIVARTFNTEARAEILSEDNIRLKVRDLADNPENIARSLEAMEDVQLPPTVAARLERNGATMTGRTREGLDALQGEFRADAIGEGITLNGAVLTSLQASDSADRTRTIQGLYDNLRDDLGDANALRVVTQVYQQINPAVTPANIRTAVAAPRTSGSAPATAAEQGDRPEVSGLSRIESNGHKDILGRLQRGEVTVETARDQIDAVVVSQQATLGVVTDTMRATRDAERALEEQRRLEQLREQLSPAAPVQSGTRPIPV